MLAIIPARGGSKGVPKKNIRPLGGKPLILWTIETAKKSTYIDRIILSTDDEEIVSACKGTGIEIPFMRPEELAQDDSLAIDTYIYTLDRLADEFNYQKDEFVVLLPTVPFRTVSDIDSAINIFYRKQADSVISCTTLQHPLEWTFSINENELIKRNTSLRTEETMNRQTSVSTYIPNGAVYVFKTALLKDSYTYYSNRTYAYIMPPDRSVDIDTELDFQFVEFLVEKGYQNASW
ncbi:cytidylyltransferase domain-containing protein [Thermodesulfobacteriota bacterium]